MVVVAMLALVLAFNSSVNAQSGPSGDYDIDNDGLIEISNLDQLDAVRHDLNGDGTPDLSTAEADYLRAFPGATSRLGCPADGCEGYELTRGLDFNDPGSYASGAVDRGWSEGEGGVGWLPIGTHFERYMSNLDGNGHVIANLFIGRHLDYAGLFGGIGSTGSVRRLGLVDADVRGGSRVGALAGGSDGVLSDCYATGSVSGTRRVGGLVGANGDDTGTIIDSYAASNVSGIGAVGGLAGGSWGTITGSHATGNVSGTNTVGGLAGWNTGPIGTSYATGNVYGTISVGGLVGNNNNGGIITASYAAGNVGSAEGGARIGGLVGENYGAIRASYANGNVLGGSRVGGLVGANFTSQPVVSTYAIGAVAGRGSIGGLLGYNSDTSVVIGSYAIGSVSGSSGVGGLVGRNDRSNGVSASYWDIETSGQAQGVGDGFTSGIEGKTTAELKAPTSYAGIYRDWNTDIDDADGDGYETTGTDDPWDFRMDDRYPALQVDFDADGEATWEEFGAQHVAVPPSEFEVPPQPMRPSEEESSPLSCTNGTVVQDPEENVGLVNDCKALLQGRDTLAGRAALNWSTDTPIARWQGVTVEGSPTRVVGLQLENIALSGRVPPRLGELSALRVLSFRVNDLTGGIPPELGHLSELRSLDLHGNTGLGGVIPPELGNLSKLERLDLDATGLTGNIPPAFGRLSSLETLDLGQNDLTGPIPPQLAGLSNLTFLSLGRNELSGAIPPELGDLASLEGLYLAGNRLTGNIPPQLGQLSTLRSLYLGENELTGQIPQALAKLSELDSLDLSDNQLTGEIPTWLSGLSRMDSLRLHGNRLSGTIPAGLGNLTRLTLLYLHENQLTGTIPPELGSLSRLGDFILGHNQLTGPIPEELSNLGRLEVLDFGHNGLTGVIPRRFGNLSSLQFLVLDNNRITGGIPAELGNLTELRYLRLNDNQLTGPIPPELAALSNIRELDVTGNDVTGCAPWFLAQQLILDFYREGQLNCFPPVAEGGTLSVEASRLVEDDGVIVAVGDAVNGTVFLDGPEIIYTHDGSETTTDSFTYVITDGASTATATAEITVTPVNDPPVAVGDRGTVEEGSTLHVEAPALLYNDSDAESDTLTITAVEDAVNGTVFLDGTEVIYTHDGSETTVGSFTYTVTDGMDTDTATVEITVLAINDPPTAVGDRGTVEEGYTLHIEAATLLSNDSDAEGDRLSIVAVGDARNGTASLDGTTIAYEHDGTETTADSFGYTVTDGADTSTATVEIRVVPVNDPPVATEDTGTVEEGGTLSIEAAMLLSNDSDAESDRLRIVEVGDALNGTVSLDGTTVTYEHDGTETTADSFGYTVTDGVDTDTTTMEIRVTPVNDPPVATGDTGTVDEGGTLSIEAAVLLSNDSDAESDRLRIVAVGDARNGTVSLDGMTITYEHDGTETTAGSFTYTVTDGEDTATAAVEITVVPVADTTALVWLIIAAGVVLASGGAVVVLRKRNRT